MNSEGAVYRRDGMKAKQKRGTGWTLVPSQRKFVEVAVFNGSAWARTAAGQLFLSSTDIQRTTPEESFCPKRIKHFI